MRLDLTKLNPPLRKLHAEQPGSVTVGVLLRTHDHATSGEIALLREFGLDVQAVAVDVLTADATLADVAKATTLPFVVQIDAAEELELDREESEGASWLDDA